MKTDDIYSDSLLTLPSKLTSRPVHTNSMTTSLTDVSSLSYLHLNSLSTGNTLHKSKNREQTCSCSTCTCSNNSMIKSNFLSLEDNNDCLTHAFIIVYENSIWCMQSIYELFFKSLWQILIYVKQELQQNRGDKRFINSMDMISVDNSTDRNYLLKYSESRRYHLSMSQSKRRYHRLPISNGQNKLIFADKASCTISNHRFSQKNNSSSKLESIDTHIVVIPVRSSYCQTVISKNDLPIVPAGLNQSENINLHEQLNDALCRRLHEPLIFMNRALCYEHKRSSPQRSDKEFFSYKQPTNEPVFASYSAIRNDKQSTINIEKTDRIRLLPELNSQINESPNTTKPSPPDPIDVRADEKSLSNSSKPFLFDLHERKRSHKKSRQKRRLTDDNHIPLALATSLHSNVSLCNDDYFLSKYIHQLFTDSHHLR